MASDIALRAIHFARYKSLSVSDLERVCGLGNGTISSLSERTRKSTYDRIYNAFPELNIDWLKTGVGEMLIPGVQPDENRAAPHREDEVPEQFVSYLVPMAAMGGSLVGFEQDGVLRENCERVISPIADIDWVVPVCGDSMEPEYPNGSKVYVRRIEPGDFIAWGNVFVLDTTNGIVIKVVVESQRDDCVRCMSLNPSGRYAPFDVPKRSIRAMYRVMLCVSVK